MAYATIICINNCMAWLFSEFPSIKKKKKIVKYHDHKALN